MRKLLILSLLVFASIAAKVSNAKADISPPDCQNGACGVGGYAGSFGGSSAGGGIKEIQAGEKLHLCVKGEADANLFHPAEEGSDKGIIMTLEGAGTDLFQPRQNLMIANGGKSDEITLRNKENGPYFTNANLVYFQNDYDLLSQNKILNAYDSHEDFDPYIDYESESSHRIACTTPSSNGLRYFVPSAYKIKAESFLLHVTEVHAIEAEPEDNAVNPEEEGQQQRQDPVVAPLNNPGLNNDNPASPSNGGCGCSVTSAVPGMNLGLSFLFSLVLGAHALLRFRKK